MSSDREEVVGVSEVRGGGGRCGGGIVHHHPSLTGLGTPHVKGHGGT